jgi:hypothetical protein
MGAYLLVAVGKMLWVVKVEHVWFAVAVYWWVGRFPV